MSIPVKTDAGLRDTVVPWICIAPGVVVPSTKVFVKTATSVVKEAWPLQPGGVQNLLATTVYRNDRIELDVDWDAPAAGETVATYYVFVNGVSYPVTAPTTALTLTNNGGGYQHLAGQNLTVSVIARSAAGRDGVPVSTTVRVAQSPVPPAPSTYTIDIQDAVLTHSWTHPGGSRISGVEIEVSFANGPYVSFSFPANATSAVAQPWDPATVGGGAVLARLRTVGPGGQSAWTPVSGELPAPVAIGDYRFYNGVLSAEYSGASPAVQVHYQQAGGAVTLSNEATAASGTLTVPASSAWARDNITQYRMVLRPRNPGNGWTGRWQYLGWVRKMANPYTVWPVDSNTLRSGVWRNSNEEWQGASANGNNRAFAFYGNRFIEQLGHAYVGYRIRVGGAVMAMHRTNAGGLGGPVRPRLWLHRAQYQNVGDLNIEGGYDMPGFARGQAGWPGIPVDWGQMLVDGWQSYKGIALYHPNTVLRSDLGGVSSEYMIFHAVGASSVEGHPVFSIRLYHDG